MIGSSMIRNIIKSIVEVRQCLFLPICFIAKSCKDSVLLTFQNETTSSDPDRSRTSIVIYSLLDFFSGEKLNRNEMNSSEKVLPRTLQLYVLIMFQHVVVPQSRGTQSHPNMLIMFIARNFEQLLVLGLHLFKKNLPRIWMKHKSL